MLSVTACSNGYSEEEVEATAEESAEVQAEETAVKETEEEKPSE